MNQYLLLDAARMGMFMDEIKALESGHDCLYRTKDDPWLESVAPFLFTFGPALKNYFFEKGWGDGWGLIVGSDYPFPDIYKHFRRFLTIKKATGEELYFRFYDPRVLRIFLPTCHTGQLKEFFGPVAYFLTEDEEKELAIKFSFQNDGLAKEGLSFEQISGHPVKANKSYVSIKDIENNAAARLKPAAAEPPVKAENAVKANIPGKGKWNLFG